MGFNNNTESLENRTQSDNINISQDQAIDDTKSKETQERTLVTRISGSLFLMGDIAYSLDNLALVANEQSLEDFEYQNFIREVRAIVEETSDSFFMIGQRMARKDMSLFDYLHEGIQ